MAKQATYTHPFLTYQIHQIESDEDDLLIGSQFFPSITGRSWIFQVDSASVRAIIYNLYLYTEDKMLVETFVHKFGSVEAIEDYHLRVPMVVRTVHDAFPKAGRFPSEVEELTVWQFTD
jgi:hypothetical protein